MRDEKWISTERFIIKGLLENEHYFRRSFSNLDKKHFSSKAKTIVSFIKKYYQKYQKLPQYSIIENILEDSKDEDKKIEMSLNFFKEIKSLDFNSVENEEWLFDETKKFVKEKSMFLFLQNAFEKYSSDKEEDLDLGVMYSEMKDIVSISWNEDLGLFYSDMTQFDETFDRLNDQNKRIPTGILPLDDKIGGGIIQKCLLVLVGESGIGKTMFLSNLAMSAVKSGKNVVYITFEISRDHIFSRYTGAFTDLSLKTINDFRQEAKKRASELYASGSVGEFVIQEYAPGSVSTLEIDTYLGELKMKKNFTPDVIVVDYLGIMRPVNTDVKHGYERGKEVCENLRALSFKYNCPVYSASQSNRGSYGQERVGMDDVSDSLGISMTADLMIGITRPPEFQDLPQLRGEIIKSRLSEKGASFIIPIDKDKLKILNESVSSTTSEEQKTAKLVDELTKKKAKKDAEKKNANDDDDDDDGVDSNKGDRNSRGIKIK